MLTYIRFLARLRKKHKLYCKAESTAPCEAQGNEAA